MQMGWTNIFFLQNTVAHIGNIVLFHLFFIFVFLFAKTHKQWGSEELINYNKGEKM